MRRLVWVAVGAAGGIAAYRKGQQLWAQANDQGVWATVSAVQSKATGMVVLLRDTGGTSIRERLSVMKGSED